MGKNLFRQKWVIGFRKKKISLVPPKKLVDGWVRAVRLLQEARRVAICAGMVGSTFAGATWNMYLV